MIKGNFQLDVAGVNIQFNYTVDPTPSTHNDYDLVFFREGDVYSKDQQMVTQMRPLTKVLFQRVHEQKNIHAESLGVNLK